MIAVKPLFRAKNYFAHASTMNVFSTRVKRKDIVARPGCRQDGTVQCLGSRDGGAVTAASEDGEGSSDGIVTPARAALEATEKSM